MAFTNQEAIELNILLHWIVGKGCIGLDQRLPTDAEALKAAKYLMSRDKTGQCAVPRDILAKHWPVRTDLFTRGTCAVCGCTDDRACEGGCCWVNGACTLCSACAIKLGIMDLFTESPLQRSIKHGSNPAAAVERNVMRNAEDPDDPGEELLG